MPQNRTASDYSADGLLRIRQTCLHVASSIPSALANEITVVGGLVPSLLIDDLSESDERHLGTADLDIALALGLQGVDRYNELTGRLSQLGFKPERAKDGKAAGLRWKSGEGIEPEVFLDVLPVLQSGGNLETDAGIPGVELSDRTGFAFRDRVPLEMREACITGEIRKARIWVCGPGAYIVIKALTFAQRHLYKDAYDLFYVLKNYGTDVQEVVGHLRPLLYGSPEAQRAMKLLHDDFADPNGDGAMAVPLFLYGKPDDDLQADVAGHACKLLDCFGMA